MGVQANTGYCEIQVNEDLRFINWAKDRDDLHTGCMHWEEVDWCGNSPQVCPSYIFSGSVWVLWGSQREKFSTLFCLRILHYQN